MQATRTLLLVGATAACALLARGALLGMMPHHIHQHDMGLAHNRMFDQDAHIHHEMAHHHLLGHGHAIHDHIGHHGMMDDGMMDDLLHHNELIEDDVDEFGHDDFLD